MNLKNKQEIIEKFGANAIDTGSAEVQIAMLTKKISELTEHMKSNKKDFATKRGLLMMVGKRKRLLSFLKDRNLEGYRSLIKESAESDEEISEENIENSEETEDIDNNSENRDEDNETSEAEENSSETEESHA